MAAAEQINRGFRESKKWLPLLKFVHGSCLGVVKTRGAVELKCSSWPRSWLWIEKGGRCQSQ
jgi:hypothetical protein